MRKATAFATAAAAKTPSAAAMKYMFGAQFSRRGKITAPTVARNKYTPTLKATASLSTFGFASSTGMGGCERRFLLYLNADAARCNRHVQHLGALPFDEFDDLLFRVGLYQEQYAASAARAAHLCAGGSSLTRHFHQMIDERRGDARGILAAIGPLFT